MGPQRAWRTERSRSSYWTTRVTVVLCVGLPLVAVPVTVSVYVPAGVLVDVATVSVELPPEETVLGLSDALARLGTPATRSRTLPVKPPVPVTPSE